MPAVASSVPMPVTIATTSRVAQAAPMDGRPVDGVFDQSQLAAQRYELHRHCDTNTSRSTPHGGQPGASRRERQHVSPGRRG